MCAKKKRKTAVVQLSCEENFTTELLYFSQYMKMVGMISWMQRFAYNSLHCSKKRRVNITSSRGKRKTVAVHPKGMFPK
ncbi:hypothetical protein JTE90_015753 [Oedothorax gibbosus]|uniref:Uncharacterized protein n=1 Tax=Oedothorax gibbosus TaxID=931172 RepID=A0AAV6TSU1_9ARAC|nr:hypothetical protein JTE90_015753 [Oedothorax gibbosus]